VLVRGCLGLKRRFFAFCDCIVLDWGESDCCGPMDMNVEGGVGMCSVWCYGGTHIGWVVAEFGGLGRN
jgi:hypothetical protein